MTIVLIGSWGKGSSLRPWRDSATRYGPAKSGSSIEPRSWTVLKAIEVSVDRLCCFSSISLDDAVRRLWMMWWVLWYFADGNWRNYPCYRFGTQHCEGTRNEHTCPDHTTPNEKIRRWCNEWLSWESRFAEEAIRPTSGLIPRCAAEYRGCVCDIITFAIWSGRVGDGCCFYWCELLDRSPVAQHYWIPCCCQVTGHEESRHCDQWPRNQQNGQICLTEHRGRWSVRSYRHRLQDTENYAGWAGTSANRLILHPIMLTPWNNEVKDFGEGAMDDVKHSEDRERCG